MKTPSPNQEALDLQKRLNRLTNQVFKIADNIAEIRKKIELICIHNETKKINKYEPGGYLNREIFINQIICTVCGKVIKEEKITGGFN